MHQQWKVLFSPFTFLVTLPFLTGGLLASRSLMADGSCPEPPTVSQVDAPLEETRVAALSSAAAIKAMKAEYQRPAEIPFPADNQFTHARELLGRTLFFDPRLSGSSWISCASCHNPALDWGDGLAKGIGHNMKELGRRTPTVLNLAWASSLFWDGRAGTLEEQALGPIGSAGEMNLPLDQLEKKVKEIKGYAPLFKAAYPSEPMGLPTIAKAIATFERTLVSEEAPFDRWVQGDEKAISESAKRGFALFNTSAGCNVCHSGWRFTDDSFHDIGVTGDDKGRGVLLPGLESMQYAFKTPTLRNADRRGPYMHNGSEETLGDVIDLYNQGGREKRPSLSSEIRPLNLSDSQKADLEAFLLTLTSQDPGTVVPTLPH